MKNFRFERLGFFGLIAYVLFLAALLYGFEGYVFALFQSFMLVIGTGLVGYIVFEQLKKSKSSFALPMKQKKETLDVAGIIKAYQKTSKETKKEPEREDEALEEFQQIWTEAN